MIKSKVFEYPVVVRQVRQVATRFRFAEIGLMIMRTALAGELNVLANALLRIAEADRRTCDFTFNSLRYALREVVASFPVYRTYVAPGRVSEVDRLYIEQAVDAARSRSRAADVSVFDFMREVMLGTVAEGRDEGYRNGVIAFAMKLQQYTAPVMAKGMEDTTFYIYARLVSLNEVGGDPRAFGVPVLAFHRANRERHKQWPHNLLATSTHDSKRAEDVRARIDVLSELPEEWRAKAMQWHRINRGRKQRLAGEQAPDRNEEYLLYQTLIGAWPLQNLDAAGMEAFRERIREYMLKAIREAKVHTSWINRNERKRKTVQKYAALRAELKAKKDYVGLTQLPRDASPSRVVNRCQVSGRRRAFIRRFKISRLTFRELASAGLIPGVTKSSW